MGGYYGYYGGYFSYLAFMLPGIILVIWAQFRVRSSFKKYGAIGNARGITGRQAAEMVLRAGGVTDVRIEMVSGSLTDHFDPTSKVIRLSEPVYGQPTIAAVGIAAHEAGHAVQHAVGYGPIKIRTAIIPICNIGSQIGIPIAIIGMFLDMLGLVWIGIGLFSLAVVFQLVTLPVEFNASRRAMQAIESSGMLTADEANGARSVLTAAAMTYVAAMMQALLTLFYYILRLTGGNKKK